MTDITTQEYEFVDPMGLRPGDTFQRPGLEHVYTVLGRNEELSVPGLLYLRILIVQPDGAVFTNYSVPLEVPGDLEIRFLRRGP